MRYDISVALSEDKIVETSISVRIDAKLETLAFKVAEAIIPVVLKNEIIVFEYEYEKPNIWTNGAFPSMWLKAKDEYYRVCVTRSDGLGVFY